MADREFISAKKLNAQWERLAVVSFQDDIAFWEDVYIAAIKHGAILPHDAAARAVDFRRKFIQDGNKGE